MEELILITKDGDGQCVMSDLRAVLQEAVKDLKVIFPVWSASDITHMLASKYHLMLHDLRWLAQDPARFFRLSASACPATRDAVSDLVLLANG